MINRKVVLFRPHKGPWFKLPLAKQLFRKKAAVKYSYIVDECDVYYIPYIKTWAIKTFVFNIKEVLGLVLWCLFYKKEVSRIRFHVENNDVLFFFCHGNLSTVSESFDGNLVYYLSSLKCKKVCHLTHFQYSLKDSLDNIAKVKPDLIVGEGDPRLVNDKLKDVMHRWEFRLLPFVVEPRFYSEGLNSSNQVILSGTIAPRINDKEFFEFFNTNCLQPERLSLYEKFSNNKSFKMLISNKYSGDESGLNNQQTYFEIPIDQEYRKSKFAILTSEVVGFPAIGMFEAMSSGCVVISTDLKLLSLYGMEANMHYIYVNSYDDVETTLDSISISVVEQIRKRSLEKAIEFSTYKVKERFLNICNEL